ncbi:hypothetical protein [Micromonospora sp. NPDC005806]|uniref:hypothetical protein n=1 Tax=Micromonospora sp. NPDC005806 TaxID=3364234 RepID=UPI0036CBEF52
MIMPPSGSARIRLDWSRLGRRAFPIAVVGCWLVWAALAWWTAPRAADQAELDRDLAGGRVVTWFRADGWSTDAGAWGRRPQPRYASEGWMVVWSRPDGQIRYTNMPVDGSATGSDPMDDRLARNASLRLGDAPAESLANAAGLLGLTLGLGWLVMLVAGPPPVAGTRWFWFWIGLLPFGLGVLAWLYRERWRSDVPPTRARGSGWAGLGWLLVGGLLLSVAVAGLGVLLGGYLVPGG